MIILAVLCKMNIERGGHRRVHYNSTWEVTKGTGHHGITDREFIIAWYRGMSDEEEEERRRQFR